MRIGVLGTGIVGQMLASKLTELGHDVVIGTRDPEASLARTEPVPPARQSFADWHRDNPAIVVETFEGAAKHGELVVNATSGEASLDALRAAGAANLDGKVLVDVANPLDFSQGMPPFLSVSNTDSLGEQIQREFPNAKVVKTLNTVTAMVMVAPQAVAGGDHSISVAGNDDGAKGEVIQLLGELGWREDSVIDLGDITGARGMEMVLPLWVRLLVGSGDPMFNFKVVR